MIESLGVGHKVQFEVVVTGQDVSTFLALSRDSNPIHSDPARAAAAGFPQPVVPGMLLGAYLSRLVGAHLPGPDSVLHEVQLRFQRPTFCGDRLTFVGEVVQVSAAARTLVLKLAVDRAGERIASGRVQVGLPGASGA